MKSLFYLRRYLLRYPWRLIAGTASVFVANWFGLLIPRYVGLAVDFVKSASPTSTGLIRLAGTIMGLAIIQGIFLFLMRYTIIGAARNIEFDFRNDLFAKFQSLHPGYYDAQKTGDLMARSTNDIDAVRMVLGPGIMFMINTTFIFPLAIYQMFKVNIPLTCYSIIPLLVMPIFVNRVGNRIHRRFRAVQEQYSIISAFVQENLTGIRVIKAFVQEAAQLGRFGTLNKEFIKRNLALAHIRAGFFPGMRILGGLGIMILLWLGGSRVIEGRLTLGDLIALTMLHLQLFWPMIAFGWIISLHQRGAASMKRILCIFEQTPDVGDTSETDFSIHSLRGEIQIRNLTFTYPGKEQPVLEALSAHIGCGKTLGIVGPIGSGKTTLIRLIARLYNPPPETVFIDGTDVRKIPLNVLRNHIGYVFQEPFLFSDTIRNNIAFGAPNATDDAIMAVAGKVQLHDEIMSFPEGYDTMLGERGVNLSGGQKQRLAIARALIKNPRILILDDTLSAVDTHTEAMILKMLHEEMKGRTSIVISHRISSVIRADEIIVLEQGVITEQGTHSRLFAIGGLYATIYEKQRLEEEIAQEAK